jgi:tetratricopeptide (TPR) repeat protein
MEKSIAQAKLEKAREEDYVYYFHLLIEDLFYEEDGQAKIANLYKEHWPRVREDIKKYYFSETADGILAKPCPNFMYSLYENERMLYGNDIQDIDIALCNEKKYEERIAFAQDCLDLFDWYKADGSKSSEYWCLLEAIGEALSDAGRVQESDDYYEKIMHENPGNNDIIASYIWVLFFRGEKARAKELLEAHISLNIDPTPENETLILRAILIYEDEGNQALADKYSRLCKQIGRSTSLITSKTVVKVGKKIYPNDPCPCGSGKKYKKCCGRN